MCMTVSQHQIHLGSCTYAQKDVTALSFSIDTVSAESLLSTVAVAIFRNVCHIVKCMAVTHHMVARVLLFIVTVDEYPPIRISVHYAMR